MSKRKYKIGDTSGNWTFLAYNPNGQEGKFLCRCVCGNEQIVTNQNWLKSKSCGCNKIKFGKRRKHGQYNHPSYQAWRSALRRCHVPTADNYEDYGARGIKMCERWHFVENFISDMGIRPTNKHSLDRINNDGDYEPANCRWATMKEQANNRRPPRKNKGIPFSKFKRINPSGFNGILGFGA